MLSPDTFGSHAGRIERLRRTVDRVGQIGPRNIYHYAALQQAAEFCSSSLAESGLAPTAQTYEAREKTFVNFSTGVTGSNLSKEIIVIGAHYDSHKRSPGANDNGSALG